MNSKNHFNDLLFKKRSKFSKEIKELIKSLQKRNNCISFKKSNFIVKLDDLDDTRKVQIENHLKRIYSVTNLYQLLKIFKEDINYLSDAKVKQGENNPYSFLDGPLWAIPTVQGKYYNQRFISESVFNKNLNKGKVEKLTSKENLRFEHVIDRKAIKEHFANHLTKINTLTLELSKIMVGCIIYRSEEIKIGSINEREISFILNHKNLFHKYTGTEYTQQNLSDDSRSGRYQLNETFNKIKYKNGKWIGPVPYTKLIFHINKENDSFNLKVTHIDNKDFNEEIKEVDFSKLRFIKKGNTNRTAENLVKFTKIASIDDKEFNVKSRENWRVKIFDRQAGHFLHCNHHPYQPHSGDREKNKEHEKFINSIFALDHSLNKRMNEHSIETWLNKLPLIDTQFLSESDIQEEWDKPDCECKTI